MDVKAVILIGGSRIEGAEQLGGIPIGLLDVLGRPILERVLDRLEKFGISGAAVVTETPASSVPLARGSIRPGMHWTEAQGAQFWRAAENAFNEFAQGGTEIVLVVRLGAYAELDYEELVQFHLDAGCRVTRVSDSSGMPLDTFVISASRRNDAAYLFRHELQEMRVPCDDYRFAGYINHLRDPRDFRVLALDGFAGIANIPPCGKETKPGVWLGDNARVHRTARLLAPCFIGANANVRAAALLTRGSVAEHHTEIDCGTVVENSSILQTTKIGAGLDVTHSVVGFQRIWNLRRSVEVEISDRRLVATLRSAPVRMLNSAAEIAWIFSKAVAQTVLGRKPAPTPAIQDALCRPAAALKNMELAKEETMPAADLLSVRRYGNE
jgi:NDP-sugar pyrophosphorylase family protein